MRESVTYQAILREGRDEGEREGRIAQTQRLLLRQGTKRFHAPDSKAIAAIEAIRDIDRLEALGDLILEPGIHDWAELLQNS